MPRLTVSSPRYRLHRASGQAVVTLNGRDHYLGRHNSPESKARYRQLLREWQSSPLQASLRPGSGSPTLDELILGYTEHVKEHYRKNGKLTSTVLCIKAAQRLVHQLYGIRPAEEFGPVCLKTLREGMIELGWCRTTINKRIGIIKNMFRWATENELISANVYHALQAVRNLGRGRSPARETEPVQPVPQTLVEAVLPLVNSHVAAMIHLQLLTGMRPGEVTAMHRDQLEMDGPVWIYRPASHKTEHHGKERSITIGPRAQAVLGPFLKAAGVEYLFSPAVAERARNGERRARRRSPMTPSQASRRPKPNPRRAPRERYDKDSYRRAIQRACDKAGVPRWSPNQLRHNAATFLRKEFGIDAARVILGHSSPAVTEVYAELDRGKAIEIMSKVG